MIRIYSWQFHNEVLNKQGQEKQQPKRQYLPRFDKSPMLLGMVPESALLSRDRDSVQKRRTKNKIENDI